nr:unnamed protein product [Spirometra erinaceieuropaei]
MTSFPSPADPHCPGSEIGFRLKHDHDFDQQQHVSLSSTANGPSTQRKRKRIFRQKTVNAQHVPRAMVC